MKRRSLYRWFLLIPLLLLLIPVSDLEAKRKMQIIGREIMYFNLPSTHDRLIVYTDEYYGKHHLVLTFFPAAFTPI